MGASQDPRAARRRRVPRLAGDRPAGARSPRAAAAGRLPARAPRARRGPQGRVRLAADTPQPRLADRLLELETAGGGTWQMSGVVDYVAKLALCCPVTTTKTWRDAVGALEDARGAAQDLLGVPLLEDCTCPDTGELMPVIVVSDDGQCYRAVGFARYIASQPELSHLRTRHRSPGTNGVIERVPVAQVRAPLPPRDRRRARARRARRPLPRRLQPSAPARSASTSTCPSTATRRPEQRPPTPEEPDLQTHVTCATCLTRTIVCVARATRR